MPPVRVFIVDDHPFFRSGVASWLNQQPGVLCCGEAESVAAARGKVEALKPDVVLLDLHLNDGDGLDFTAELTETFPTMRVIILSQADEEVFAHRAIRAGARGYIMKSEATETVLSAIETVQRGEVFVSRSVSALLLHNLYPDPASKAPELAKLSDRELQVFQLVGAGCKNGEIALKLGISRKTVDTYRENLKEKLGLPDADSLHRAAKRWVQSGELGYNAQPQNPSPASALNPGD